jgi:hypothetical protein
VPDLSAFLNLRLEVKEAVGDLCRNLFIQRSLMLLFVRRIRGMPPKLKNPRRLDHATCIDCKLPKPLAEFRRAQYNKKNRQQWICRGCQDKKKGDGQAALARVPLPRAPVTTASVGIFSTALSLPTHTYVWTCFKTRTVFSLPPSPSQHI